MLPKGFGTVAAPVVQKMKKHFYSASFKRFTERVSSMSLAAFLRAAFSSCALERMTRAEQCKTTDARC